MERLFGEIPTTRNSIQINVVETPHNNWGRLSLIGRIVGIKTKGYFHYKPIIYEDGSILLKRATDGLKSNAFQIPNEDYADKDTVYEFDEEGSDIDNLYFDLKQ